MATAQVGWEEALLDAVEFGYLSAHEHVAVVGVDEPGADQDMEMCGSAEGAAALCGGGESEQVGDRPRADCGGPVQANVWMSRGVVAGC